MEEYPELNDSHFEQKLFDKREFRMNVIPKETRTTEEICSASEILPHQKFASRYINPNTPYPGALFFHKTGTGKTILAVKIGEQFRKLSKKKPLILVKNKKLKSNFEKTLLGITTGPNAIIGEEFLTNQERLDLKDPKTSPDDIKIIRLKSRKAIRNAYEISTYDTFINKNPNPSKISNRLVIIDEVHNFRADNNRYQNFKNLTDASKKTTMVLLSATPMFDSPEEISDIFNLMLKKEEQLLTGNNFAKAFINSNTGLLTLKGKTEIEKKIKGRVSYVGIDKHAFPKRQDIGKSEIEGFKVVQCKMSKHQFNGYKVAVKKDTTVARVDPRQASIFVFPDGTFGTDGFSSKIGGKNNFITVTKRKKIPGSKRGGGIAYSLNPSFKSKINTIEKLKEYSCKYAQLIKNIKKASGQILIYSRFISGGGIILLSNILKLHGIEKVSMITGTTTNPVNIVDAFNRGEINVILGSDAISEGIDFKNINEVHILNPEWNNSKMDQVIGRAIRNCSHVNNPNKKVKVFKYVSIGPDKDEDTIDVEMYKIVAKKDKGIKNIEKLLKESAFDCNFNKNRNGVKCKVSVKKSKGRGIDNSTYVLSEDDVVRIEKTIGSLFKSRLIVPLSRIELSLTGDYKPDIYSVLGNMLENKSQIVHNLLNGYLIHRGNFYIFQPSNSSERLSLNKRSSVKIIDASSVDNKKKISIEEFLRGRRRVAEESESKNNIDHTDNVGILNVNEFGILTPKISKTLGDNMIRFGVHGGGTCFFHSVLESVDKKYQGLSRNDKIKEGIKWRKQLAKNLDTKYDEFGYDDTFAPTGITKEIFKELLNDAGSFVGNESWIYVSDFLDINIIIYRLDSDSIYCGLGDKMTKPGRRTIIIANVSDVHYEPIFQKKKDGSFVRTFKTDGVVFKKIISDYNKTCKERSRVPSAVTQIKIINTPLVGFFDPKNKKFKLRDNRGKTETVVKDKRKIISGAVCQSIKKDKLIDIAKFLNINDNLNKMKVSELCSGIEKEIKKRKWVM